MKFIPAWDQLEQCGMCVYSMSVTVTVNREILLISRDQSNQYTLIDQST